MSFGAELLVEEAPGEATFDLVSSGEIVARSPMQLFWRRFRSDRSPSCRSPSSWS